MMPIVNLLLAFSLSDATPSHSQSRGLSYGGGAVNGEMRLKCEECGR